MNSFDYTLEESANPQMGLVVLQSDLRIESDFRALLPADHKLLATRVPSGREVTSETLSEMQHHLAAAAGLFPQDHQFDVVGYGCTSGSAEIGPDRIAEFVQQGCAAKAVTEPVSALVAACRALGVQKLAVLSPYIETVSAKLRDVLHDHGIETPVFGTFAEPEETKVAAITEASTQTAALSLMEGEKVDALFLSCTNLRTLGVIEPLETALDIPVLSSNLVLAWHMQQLANVTPQAAIRSRLFG